MGYPLSVRDVFVDLVCRDGVGPERAGPLVGVSAGLGSEWARQAVRMSVHEARRLGLAGEGSDSTGRGLTLAERGAIQLGLRAGKSQAWIARELGRDRSVVSRELARNRGSDGNYYASSAHLHARRRRRRPKTPLLARPESAPLRAFIESSMDAGWSPKLIADVVAREPDAMMGRVSHETIYRALYVQARGLLRQDLHRRLSTGRARRKPQDGSARSSSPYSDAFRISQRPAPAR